MACLNPPPSPHDDREISQICSITPWQVLYMLRALPRSHAAPFLYNVLQAHYCRGLRAAETEDMSSVTSIVKGEVGELLEAFSRRKEYTPPTEPARWSVLKGIKELWLKTPMDVLESLEPLEDDYQREGLIKDVIKAHYEMGASRGQDFRRRRLATFLAHSLCLRLGCKSPVDLTTSLPGPDEPTP